MGRPFGLLTIDLEDYRRQELRDHRHKDEPPHSDEVARQLDRLLGLLEECDVRATCFSVGRLAFDLPRAVWRQIAARHRIACHGYEHLRVQFLGRSGFEEDLRLAKAVLEDATGQRILSYRAPYFSGERCDPWFGEVLARAGLIFDSSRRLRSAPPGFQGTIPLAGSGGAVREIPLPSIGFGSKRIVLIGGSYLRLLPLQLIVRLLDRARSQGFIPTVYLHPYDLDPTAAPLEYERFRQWFPRLGDWVRRCGRSTTAEKLRALARIFDLRPVESLIEPCWMAVDHTLCAQVGASQIGPPIPDPIAPSGLQGRVIEFGGYHGMPRHVA